MTKPIVRPAMLSGGYQDSGTTETHYVYCMATACMSWEARVGEEQLEGYCKLMETNFEYL